MEHVVGEKWDRKSAVKALESKGYAMVDPNEFLNVSTKFIFKDSEGYYYFNSLHKINLSSIQLRFFISNPYTIYNIKLWCKLNNKPFELLSETYERNSLKLKWQCFKEECGEEFESTWADVFSGKGCGYCTGMKVGLSNCLATLKPKLAKEWHPTKNGKLTPFNVTCYSHKEVYWQCSKNHKHVWQDSIAHRNDKTTNRSCPYCSGHKPSEDYNLLVIKPKLSEEWDYSKNINNPEEYTPMSHQYAWWICKECNHSWEARIYSRKSNGCPQCTKSKGEKRCKEVFINKGFIEIIQKEYDNLSDADKNKNTYFIPQKTFDDLVGIGDRNLSYDFYIPNYNFLTEFQGQFHDGTANIQTEEDFKIQQEHDRRKRDYAKNNNIALLEIWYWDFDNIEDILLKYLKIQI